MFGLVFSVFYFWNLVHYLILSLLRFHSDWLIVSPALIFSTCPVTSINCARFPLRSAGLSCTAELGPAHVFVFVLSSHFFIIIYGALLLLVIFLVRVNLFSTFLLQFCSLKEWFSLILLLPCSFGLSSDFPCARLYWKDLLFVLCFTSHCVFRELWQWMVASAARLPVKVSHIVPNFFKNWWIGANVLSFWSLDEYQADEKHLQ